jgi:hypothetical protein
MPAELSFVIPLTIIFAGIIAIFFWAQSGRKKAQIEEAQRQEALSTAAAAGPGRERKKWAAAAAANAEQDVEEGDAPDARVPLTKKQQIKMQRAEEVHQLLPFYCNLYVTPLPPPPIQREEMLEAQRQKRCG